MKKIYLFLIMSVLLVSFLGTGVLAKQPEMKKVIIGFHKDPNPGLVKAYGGEVDIEYDIIPAVAGRLPEKAILALEKNPHIDYIEEDAVAYALEDTLPWGIDKVDAEVVFGGSEGAVDVTGNAGEGVVVAVLDTGINYTHPDLAPVYAGGYDFVNNDDDPLDDQGHGTHVSGTIAAADDEAGVIGVAPEVSIKAVKVLGSDGSGSYSGIIAGIEWAVDNGSDVISMSLGGGSDVTALEDAVNKAYNSGVLVVASAGNSGNRGGGGDNVGYPARYDSAIAVAATDSNDNRASFSSTGPAVEISAPGVDILSTYLDGLAYASGTSMACPHVSGVAALVIAEGVTDPVQVRQILRDSAIDLGDEGRDTRYGYGLVQADDAVALAGPVEHPPVADAGADQDLVDSDNDGIETVTLDGSASYDSDGNIVTYEWSNETGEVVSNDVEFITNLPIGTYTFTLNVTDDSGLSSTDDVIVSVVEYVNQAPVADAGVDQDLVDSDADGSETVTLNASGSSDPEDDALTFEWSLSGTVIGKDEIMNYDFEIGTYTVDLLVTDSYQNTDSDSVLITVSEPTLEPSITLSALGYKVRGAQHVDLNWSGATTDNVDVYRDGSKLTTTENDGFYTDVTGVKGGGSYTYQVCEEASTLKSDCSETIEVSI